MRKFIIPFATAVVLALSCEKTPEEVAVSGVSIDRSTVEMTIGETVQLSATVKPADATDQTITWSSSRQSVATVNDHGLVTALAEGRTTIKARIGGKTSACIVTVNKEFVDVTSITLDKNSLSLIKGESETLVATVKPANATHKKVSWTSSDSGVATVDSEGLVSAIANGSATITAQIDNIKATCDVTVTVPIESITLNKTELSLTKGQSETLIATIIPSDATESAVKWETTNSHIASVENGKVTAIGGGRATITAKAGDKVAFCIVTVTVPIESVTLNYTEISLNEGESLTLNATIIPKDATVQTISWSSSDDSIATVDQNGTILAIKQGFATIFAQVGDKQATCIVTVIKRVTSIALDKGRLNLLVGETSTLTAIVLPEDATDKTVTWYTYDSSVATVENGVVKGTGIGETIIVASAGRITATCNVTVTIDSPSGVYTRFNGGDFEIIDDVVQAGGNLIFGVHNYSSETIHVISVQWIDGKTGLVTDALSIDSDISSGDSGRWTIPIGDSGIYSPTARFNYIFKGETFTCEGQITPL